MSITSYHAKYIAHELTKSYSSNSLENFTASISVTQVVLNPRHVNTDLFAFQSPLSKVSVLAFNKFKSKKEKINPQ